VSPPTPEPSLRDDDPFRSPKGTHDVIPPESAAWVEVVAAFAERARRSAFGLVLTPVYEHVEVFHRVGEATDVVSKEMYEFHDKGGRHLALKPESTAAVVRAFVQHRPATPWKVWYVTPHLRHEKPQKGRYRQHHQLGVEVLGVDDPDVDVEVIALAHGFYRDVGLRGVRLRINSLGDAVSRPRYLDALRAYLRERAGALSDEAVARIDTNPLRVLDSKRAADQVHTADAPVLLDHLTDESRDHFERVKSGLDALGIEYHVDPRLVRGLDYYTRTTFEFTSAALDAAQDAVGGGGRYDQLSEAMGGPPAPGIGFGIGIERLLLAREGEGIPTAGSRRLDAFVVDMVGGAEATVLLAELRDGGLAADRDYGARKPKKQFQASDRSGARVAVILGEAEQAQGLVSVKDLDSGIQSKVPRRRIVEHIRRLLTDGPPPGAPDVPSPEPSTTNEEPTP
jgi:histidyl-tRNA synthetase